MKEDFYVTTSVNGQTLRTVWDTAEPLAVGMKGHWSLERTEHGFIAREMTGRRKRTPTGNTILIPFETVTEGRETELPFAIGDEARALTLRIHPLRPIKPAYLPTSEPLIGTGPDKRPSVLFIFYGVKKLLVRYARTGGDYKAIISRKRIFDCVRKDDAYEVTAYKEGLTLEHNGHKRLLVANLPERVTEEEMIQGTIEWGIHWWRMNRIPIPPALPPKEEDEETPDRVFYKKVSLSVSVGFALLLTMVMLTPKPKEHAKVTKPPVEITLKQPKIVQKKPEPVVIAEPKPAPEPPKPTPKKPEPPPKKVAEQPPPKPQPPQKVAQPKPQPPTPAAPPAPSPEQVKAKQQAQLAASLSFLSPSQNRPAANVPNNLQKANEKYNNVTAVDTKATSNTLKNMAAQSTAPTGNISTNNARNIASDVNLEGGRGKSLNKVQGKVSLQALYDPNATDEIGSSISKKGISMSGSGQIPESLIEKVLSKHVQKFQYCYEKALLTDASLAGNIIMQWTITASGSPTEVKVVRSAMNNPTFHSCITRELSGIQFPKPSGGSVTVKYPLAFSSATL